VHGVRDDASAKALQIAGRAVNYAYLHRFHETQIIENVRRAEREGFDAVMIGALQDPGLQVAKSVVDIPVIGYGEASMLTALMHGSRFAFICINPDMNPVIQAMIRDQGLESRAAPNIFMDCGYADLSDAVNGKPERFMAAFEQAAHRAIHENGVDVILPGQTIIAELLWRQGMRELQGALVLDPRLSMLRMVEMLVDMRRSGLGVSRRGFLWNKPPPEMEQGVRDFYATPEVFSPS